MIFWGSENCSLDLGSIDQSISVLDESIKRNKNHVYLYKEINDNSVIKTVNNLRDAGTFAYGFRIDGINVPVYLHINSPGGLATSAFSLADNIRLLISKGLEIYTIVEGHCSSAATLVSTVGSKRFITSNSFMLIHQVSIGGWGKYEEFKDLMQNATLIMERIKEHYRKYTRFTEDDLEEILKRDLLLDAEKCLQYGLVDEII